MKRLKQIIAARGWSRFAAVLLLFATSAAAQKQKAAPQQRTNLPGQPQPTERQAGKIEPGKAVEHDLRGGQTDVFEIDVDAGEFLRVVADQEGIDLVLTLVGPDGETLVESDSENGAWGPESTSAIASAGGTFQVRVISENENAAPGRYSLRIADLRKPTPDDKVHIAAEQALLQAGRLRNEAGEDSKTSAMDYYQQALPLWRKLGDQYYEALTLMSIGEASEDSGHKQEALDYYNQALPLFRAVGDQREVAQAFDAIGRAHDDLGDRRKALDDYNQALPLERATGDHGAEAQTLESLGEAYNGLGDKQKALAYFNQALPLARVADNHSAEAQALDGIGQAYSDLGEKQKALDFYNQALPRERAVGDPALEAQTLDSLGDIYEDLGKEQKAIDYYGQALPLERAAADRAEEAATLDKIGSLYDDSGEKEKALSYYNQALPLEHAIDDHAAEAATLDKVSSVDIEFGKKKEALDSYIQALALVRAFKLSLTEVSVLRHLMNYWRRTNNPSLGIFWGKQAVTTSKRVWGDVLNLETDDQQDFVETDAVTYRDLADLLISQGRAAEAEQVLAMAKQEKNYFDHAKHPESKPTDTVTVLSLNSDETKSQQGFERVTGQLATAAEEWTRLASKPAETQTPAEVERLATASKQLDLANSAFRDFVDQLGTAFKP